MAFRLYLVGCFVFARGVHVVNDKLSWICDEWKRIRATGRSVIVKVIVVCIPDS